MAHVMRDAGQILARLRNARGWTVGPWLIGGGFNVTRFFGERTGSEIHIS